MPGGNKNIKGTDGNTFSSTNQPANRGRKPKLFSELSKQFKDRGLEKATPQAVQELYEYLLALPLSEIIEIGSNPKEENGYPAIMRIAASELVGRKKMDILREMLDRAHGKPKQTSESTGPGGGPLQIQIINADTETESGL